MSADLFAAFNSSTNSDEQHDRTATASPDPSPIVKDPFSFFTSPSRPGVAQQHVQSAEDDDGWGDFESAPASTRSPAILIRDGQWANQTASTTDPPPLPPVPRTRIVRADTIQLMTNTLVDLGPLKSPLETWRESFSPQTSTSSVAKPSKKDSNPDVLFDADDYDEDEVEDENDGFSDFEGVVTTVPKPGLAPSTDLTLIDVDLPAPVPTPGASRKPAPAALSLSSTTIPHEYPQAPKSPFGNFQARKPTSAKGLGLTTPTPHRTDIQMDVREKSNSPSPITAWPQIRQASPETEWKEFKTLTASALAHPKATALQSAVAKDQRISGREWEAWEGWEEESARSKSPKLGGLPPTNVPPPSILLSVFPRILGSTDLLLLRPLSGQSAGLRDRVLSDAATARYLGGYLGLATVAGHIIAGRKLRWHRDKFLAQGMAISTAGGKKGMKLSAVDKSQSAQEDREAGDLVSLWTQLVGPLRTAVAAANEAMAKGDGGTPLRIPDLSQSPSVQTAKMVPTAPKPCVICGLKREERVAKVDMHVEDSFGEWWTDHFGHRTCWNFWAEFEVKLRQR